MGDIDREIEQAGEYDWMMHGECRGSDPAMFFPTGGDGSEAARTVCAGCGVRAECLEYALARRIEHGVWGGATEGDRKRMLRARRRGVA